MENNSYRLEFPILDGFSVFQIPESAKSLVFSRCSKEHAVFLTRKWHSRLPIVQDAPWQYAFKMAYNNYTFAVALLSNPSARTLPSHWIELRRMACSDDCPKYTPSRFLSLMVDFFRINTPEREKVISYQDTAVHSGTIYKASGWIPEYTGKFRVRDRSRLRIGTTRLYRQASNGVLPDASPKIRWAIFLDKKIQKQKLEEHSNNIKIP